MSNKEKKSVKKEQDLARSVMQSIQKEEVTMHSRWYFLVLSAVSVISIFLTSLLAAILINLTIRDVQYAGDQGLLDLARDTDLIGAFPWFMVFFALVAIVSTISLARKLEFAYKYRSYMFFGGALGLVLALGLGVRVLGISEQIEDAEPFRPLQTLRSRAQDSILVGEILYIDDDSFTVKALDDTEVTVEVTDETQFRQGSQDLEVGREIGVFGQRIDDETWQAIRVGEKPPKPFGPRVKGQKSDRPYQNSLDGSR